MKTTISSAAAKSKKYQKRFTSCSTPTAIPKKKARAQYTYILSEVRPLRLYYWSKAPQYMQTVATAMLIYDAGKEDL